MKSHTFLENHYYNNSTYSVSAIENAVQPPGIALPLN